MTPGLLSLQVLAGNAAVADLLDGGWHGASGTGPIAAVMVQRTPVPVRTDPFTAVIERATTRFPWLRPKLEQATVHVTTYPDRTVYEIVGGAGKRVTEMPSEMYETVAGFYLMEWDSRGLLSGIANLDTGTPPPPARYRRGWPKVVVNVLSTKRERELLADRVGVVWITKTVDKPPVHKASAGTYIFPLSPNWEAVPVPDLADLRRDPGLRPLVLPGVTGGVFQPGRYYGKPLLFTYHTQRGSLEVPMEGLVSRTVSGTEYYYWVPISPLQDWIRTYGPIAGALSAEGTAVAATIAVDIALSFMPIVGPLYSLMMTVKGGYEAYHRWGEMSGWEKALVGVDVLLTTLHAGGFVVRGVKHAADIKRGVQVLTATGLPPRDALVLVTAATVFKSEGRATAILDRLNDVLKKGHLGAAELRDIESLFNLMLQKLPTAERIRLTATFAAESMDATRRYLKGMELTDRHFVGFKRLTPEVRHTLSVIATDESIVVRRLLFLAAESAEVADGINVLREVLTTTARRARHEGFAQLAEYLGADVLALFPGRITPALAKKVAAPFARGNVLEAYRRLMAGHGKVSGIGTMLSEARRAGGLPAELVAVETRFAGTFLTTTQLRGLTKLNPDALSRLEAGWRAGGAFREPALRTVASALASSDQVATVIAALAPAVRPDHLAYVLHGLGPGLLKELGRHGVRPADELLSLVGQQKKAYQALTTLTGGGGGITGLLDQLAGKITGEQGLRMAIESMEMPFYRAELFARWAMRHEDQVVGVAALKRARGADAQARLAGMYHAVRGDYRILLANLKSVGEVGEVRGISDLIADLAVEGEKAQGASLALHFAIKRVKGTIECFELPLPAIGRLGARKYDLVAGGIFYEIKYWTNFGGPALRHAKKEFAYDVVYHLTNYGNLGKLRWILARDVAAYVPAVRDVMARVMMRTDVRDELAAALRITKDEAAARLARAADTLGNVVQVF